MQQSEELRRLKEQFVSGLQGTTKWEVFCVITCLPLCPLVAAYTEAWLAARASRGLPKPLQLLARTPKFVLEFVIVVVPQVLLLMSVAPPEPAFLLLFLLWGSLALKLWMKLAHSPGSKQHMALMLGQINAPRKRFVSAFRGGLMLSTCLAILAVDFPAFPRRYAKTEDYGSGVMDVGVGAIVWAGGLVSAAAAATAAAAAASEPGSSSSSGGVGVAAGAVVGLSSSPGSGSCATAGASSSASLAAAAAAASGGGGSSGCVAAWLTRLLRGLRAAVPLVALGCARLLVTSAVGYQQHLGEYGLQWNFFHTIAAVSLLTLALPLPAAWLAPAGLAVSSLHQLLLGADLGLTQQGSLGAWLRAELSEADRQQQGLAAANKEGLGSLPGYWALHLLGAAAGHQLAATCAAASQRARSSLAAASKAAGGGLAAGGPGRAAAAVGECGRQVWSWVGAWLLLDLGLWVAAAAAEAWLEPVSRRSCNLPYVLWTSAQCLAWLLLCLMSDLLTSGLGSSSSSQPPPAGITARRAVAGTSTLPAPAAAAPQAAAAAAAVAQRSGSRRRSTSSPTAAAAAASASANGTAAPAAAPPAVEGSSIEGSPLAAKVSQHQRHQQQGASAGQGSPSSSSSTSSGSSGALAPAAAASLRQRRRSSTNRQFAPGAALAAAAAPMTSLPAAASSGASSAGPMRLLLAFNRNMLALFLLANLLTGAVNLSINTLALGNWQARAVVGCYMLVLCALAVKLDGAGITLKLW